MFDLWAPLIAAHFVHNLNRSLNGSGLLKGIFFCGWRACCRTLRNNNSSRFGRFVKLDVAPTGGIHGGLVNNYMLELSRIEFQGQGERNYHIFYQMIKGLSADDKAACGLKAAEEYEFLNKSGCYEVENVDDLKEFADVQKQLGCGREIIRLTG